MSANVTGVKTNEQMYGASSDVENTNKKNNDYGKSIGSPTLSREAEKYYEQLKKKYNNMDFILVSSDMKQTANAQAASYANPSKTVVLIDEDKIEKMAADENYRKQYEGIISNAASGLSQLKQSLGSSSANVKGYGMRFNDGGTATFFAVLKKSSQEQKARIAKKAEEKKAEQKAADKKAKKEEAAERLKNHGIKDDSGTTAVEEDTVTITANSIEELMQKISDYTMEDRSNQVETDYEKKVGQEIDYLA